MEWLQELSAHTQRSQRVLVNFVQKCGDAAFRADQAPPPQRGGEGVMGTLCLDDTLIQWS